MKNAVEKVLETEETPVLVVDKNVIRQRYREFCAEFGNRKIYYALKANPHRGIVPG